MKLVRDNIPNIITASGNEAELSFIDSKREYLVWLKAKMDEESQEFLQDPCLEEAADIYEVFLSMIDLMELQLHDVIRTADAKREVKGGFKNGVLLK